MNADQRDIAEMIIRKGIDAGFSVAVSDGTDNRIPPTRLRAPVVSALGTAEEDYLVFYQDKQRIGWVYLVYDDGNDIIRDASERQEIRALIGGEEHMPAD